MLPFLLFWIFISVSAQRLATTLFKNSPALTGFCQSWIRRWRESSLPQMRAVLLSLHKIQALVVVR